MLDNFNKIRGHFELKCLNKNGEVIDHYEEKNLIMNTASSIVGKMISGLNGTYINKLVLGTQGHIPGNILIPKTEEEGFVSDRTQLFSEESGEYNFPITFSIDAFSGIGRSVTGGSSAQVTQLTPSSIQYQFEIPYAEANDAGIAIFTEAALYADDEIFSMKTFKGKIKDDSVAIVIVWTINF